MRLSTCVLLLCVLTLLATPAAAQSTTEDGIRAVLRGDYRAAARILTPLVDDAARPDPVAQFFLAVLHDTGQGVVRDQARACGLFLRASRHEQPFSEQSAALGAFIREQFGAEADVLCVADERWQGELPQPVTAAVITAVVGGASVQTATADGVAALARGEHQRAAEILKPIAEDRRTEDTAAQFFMAAIYETGRGVPADPLRACALYQRASSNHGHPFGQAALHLHRASSLRGGREFDQECLLLVDLGFDHGFEPVTFNLGPAHSVEWTLMGATVTYQGRTMRQEMGIGSPGARFLPLQHSELATGPSRALTRHFIEVFVWEPKTRSSGEWNLRWRLFEIVRDQIIGVDTVESLATVDGDAPPAYDAFDVREYAIVRVDDAGHAEWAVPKGPRPTTQRIESDAERREVRDAEVAHAAAMNRVDWHRRYDVNRQPAMTYADTQGCGHVLLYGWTADRAEALVVRVAGQELSLSTQPATFDLSHEPMNISVEAHVYADPQRPLYFCTDVTMPPAPDSTGPEKWRAIAGTITIELSPPGIRARAPHLRRTTVTLSNVVLQNAVGTRVRMSRPVKLTAFVGSMWG